MSILVSLMLLSFGTMATAMRQRADRHKTRNRTVTTCDINSMKNKNNNVVLASRLAHAQLVAIGAANGIGGRAKTQQSKRDKARNPRLQRKQRSWQKDW